MWHNVSQELPKSCESVLCYLENGEVHEGMFLKNANKYHKNINRWKIYKYKKTLPIDAVKMWKDLPKIGVVPSANS